ncbi:unnamed protein product [Rodentolepis nana]|uniref:DBF4-type domain-containing protein n=1 Tax=Rodentolepis nana TaxID=102285 RepID=A0A158QIQ6_RODNA|nr:unnamed protein product [Rodentolepis nana]
MPAQLFPLTGKKVFLHLTRSDQLTRILCRLGADVRPFFDTSVEIVIYNPEPRQSPTSAQTRQSPTSAERAQPSSSLTPLSRGRAMVMAANQGTTPRPNDALSQARAHGIRLITLQEIREMIERLPENVLRAISGNDEEPDSHYFDPDIDRRFNVRPLQGAAAKVTERRNQYRPLYAENTNLVRALWPSLREIIPSDSSRPSDTAAGPSHPVSGSEGTPRPPILITPTMSGQSRQTAVPSTSTQHPITAPIGQTTGASRIVPSGSRQRESPAATGHTGSERRSLRSIRREEPSGYCELCATFFPQLYEHLHSSEHMAFANNPENFRGIDDAISTFESLESDLRNYLHGPTDQPSSSVVQSPYLAPGRPDTDPVAPVARTSDLPHQRVGNYHREIHSRPLPESFPLPPPLTPIYRQPPERERLLFEEDEPDEDDYYQDSPEFESSSPSSPREDPNPNRLPRLAQNHVFNFSQQSSPTQQGTSSDRSEPVIHVPEEQQSSPVSITYETDNGRYGFGRYDQTYDFPEPESREPEEMQPQDPSSSGPTETYEPEPPSPVEMQPQDPYSGGATETYETGSCGSEEMQTQDSYSGGATETYEPESREPEEMQPQDPSSGGPTETYEPEPPSPVEMQPQGPYGGGATENYEPRRSDRGERQTSGRSRVDISGTSAHQVRASSDQQRQEGSTAGNTLALPGARIAENEENNDQSPNDFSSSNSVQIGGRFRSCRKCGIAHIPSTVSSDLLQKMSQYIPGRDIDSFCPRAPHSATPDPESDAQTNQNASVCSRPSSRIFDGAEPNGEQLGKSIERSPVLNDVPLVEGDHHTPINDRSLSQLPVFEEEKKIHEKVSANSPLLEGCETAELREHGQCLPITSPHKSPVLEDTGETLPITYEQHRSYVCGEDILEENKPLERSNPGEAVHPQRSPILEDDETASLSRSEKDSPRNSFSAQVCAEDSPHGCDLRVQPNVERYHSLLQLGNESSPTGLSCLQRPLSPEVASLAGPREHVEEQERRNARLPRRASLVAREAIGLSMQALFTPTKLTSDRVFEKSHSQSSDNWSVDSSSNNGTCKLILRRVNRTNQTDVKSVSSCSSPRARSLPHILQSSQANSNISASLSSIEETEDNVDTPKASKLEEICVNTITDSLKDDEDTPRPCSRKSFALRESNRIISSDEENKGGTSTSKGVWRLLTFNSDDATSSVTADNTTVNASISCQNAHPSSEGDNEEEIKEFDDRDCEVRGA